MSKRALEIAVEAMRLIKLWRASGKITEVDFRQMKKILTVAGARKKPTPEQLKKMSETSRKTPRNPNLLSRPRALEIIRVLHNKKYGIRDLRENVGGSFDTTLKRVNELEKVGIVETEQVGSWPYKRIVSLTARGEAIFRRVYISTAASPEDMKKMWEERG